MEEEVLLINMAMLLIIGGVCSIIFKRLKMPAAIGYIIAGIILSNYWADESEQTEQIVELLSDLGLVLMMFCIGMELNLKKLRKMGTFATMVVMIQVPVMLIGGVVCGTLLGLDSLAAIVFGAIISGSSTAVITIVLAEQERISHADVETLVLVTVIEDVAQVLVMSAISPLMTGKDMEITGILVMLVTVIIFMAVAIFVGLMFVPKLVDYISDKYSDEILLICSLGLCFGLSYISVTIGMSMAIGAFLMGVIMSQAKQQKRIEHEVTPMKNVFMMMFFVSIGLLIDPMDIVNNIVTIIIIYLIYFVFKGGSVLLAYFVGNKPLRLGTYCSISLIAMGEFAFIISKEAYSNGIISSDFYASVIGAALVSMILLPLINRKIEAVCNLIEVKTPQPVVNGFLKLEAARTHYYNRMSLVTKETMHNFRKKLASAYITVVLIILVQIVFYLITPSLADFLDDITPEALDVSVLTLMIMVLNFVVLVPILVKLVASIKYLFRVYLDSDRKAIAAGTGRAHPTMAKFIRYLMNLHSLIFVVLFDFVILMVTPTPSDMSLASHILVAVAGVIVMVVIQLVMYLRRS